MNDRSYTRPYTDYNEGISSGRIPSAPVPPIEQEKYGLTVAAQQAKESGDYAEASRILKLLASICRSQGKTRDAYLTEHEAFLFDQKLIYQRAGISTSAFSETPYVEKLKTALSEGADWAIAMNQIEYAVSFKILNARICRAQGEESDAFMLEDNSYKLLLSAGKVSAWKKIPTAGMEADCLKQIAKKYGAALWKDD